MTKLFPIASAAIYVIGFIIVSTSIARDGASSVSLFKSQYLVAGLWFSFIVTACLAAKAAISEVYRRCFGGTCRRDIKGMFVENLRIYLFFGLLGFSVWFASVKLTKWLHRPSDYLSAGGLLLVFIFLLNLAWDSWVRNNTDERLGDKRLAHLAPARPIVLAGVFIACIFVFAHGLYKEITFSYGGGRYRKVKLWLNAGPKESGFLTRNGDGASAVYMFVLENENSYVVLLPDSGQRVIEIDKKVVSAIAILE